MNVRILAKFLGFLLFQPYYGAETTSQAITTETFKIRNRVSQPITTWKNIFAHQVESLDLLYFPITRIKSCSPSLSWTLHNCTPWFLKLVEFLNQCLLPLEDFPLCTKETTVWLPLSPIKLSEHKPGMTTKGKMMGFNSKATTIVWSSWEALSFPETGSCYYYDGYWLIDQLTDGLIIWPADQLANWSNNSQTLYDQPIYRQPTNQQKILRKEKGSKGYKLISVANLILFFSRFLFSLTSLVTSRKPGPVGDWCWPYHGLWSTSVWWTLWPLFWTISLGSFIGSREHTGFWS